MRRERAEESLGRWEAEARSRSPEQQRGGHPHGAELEGTVLLTGTCQRREIKKVQNFFKIYLPEMKIEKKQSSIV